MTEVMKTLFGNYLNAFAIPGNSLNTCAIDDRPEETAFAAAHYLGTMHLTKHFDIARRNKGKCDEHYKWSKISAQEVTALKTKDDLVAQVQSKYQLDKTQAQKDVDAFADGRQL